MFRYLPQRRQLLLLATRNRELLEEGLTYEGDKVDPRNIIAAVDTYLPSVWKIQESLEYSASATIKLNRELEFYWTTMLNTKRKEWKNGVFVYEVCFILVIKAMSHYNQAGNFIQQALVAEPEEARSRLVQAAKELRTGAGNSCHLVYSHSVTKYIPNRCARPR